MNLEQFINSLKYEIPEYKNMKPYIETWSAWFRGNVKDFHNYSIYSGDKTHQMKRYTLGMAKKVSENYADFLLNEKVAINIGDGEFPQGIRDILDANDWEMMSNEAVEKAMAYGTGAFVLSLHDIEVDTNTGLYKTNDSKLKIEFATADKVIPLAYSGKKVIECAFAVNRTVDNKQLIYLSIHKLENGEYVIYNYLLKDKNGNLTDISDQLDTTAKSFRTGSDIPWFSILRPAIVNNISLDSPYGISVFANSIDILKGIDIAFDSFVTEFLLGRKRIFVDADLLKVDNQSGDIKYSYDTNDVVYYTLPGLENEEKTKIHETDFSLRTDEHEGGIQLNLNLLAESVGLGGGDIYQWNSGQVKTATEIVSKNSDLYRSIRKQTIALENTLYDLFRGILYVANKYLGVPVDIDAEISFDFDDSIIEDSASIEKRALIEFNAGLIDNVEYFKITKNLTDEQAKKFVQEIEKRNPLEDEPPAEEE
jgi:Phage portal protein, SPP1 Gp6-like.